MFLKITFLVNFAFNSLFKTELQRHCKHCVSRGSGSQTTNFLLEGRLLLDGAANANEDANLNELHLKVMANMRLDKLTRQVRNDKFIMQFDANLLHKFGKINCE